jgi:hypothetical protein
MDGQAFDLSIRVLKLSVAPEGAGQIRCPACDSPLNMHQPEEVFPHRLLGTCTCEECGVWFSFIVTPDRKQMYLLRLPAIIEMVEAISRQGRE